MEATQETPVVRRDVFPAVVTGAAGPWRSARVVITTDRVLVWLTRAGPVLDTPYLPGASTVPPHSASRFVAARLALTGGGTLTVTGQRGCACGNPLKGWHPWTPYRKAPA